MSKILKVKIQRDKTAAGTNYTYPPEYDAKKIQVLCYESIGDVETVEARGGTDEYCIGVVADEDAAAFLASDDIVETTKEDAIVDGSKWRPQVVKTNNQDAVNLVFAKAAKKEELAVEDVAVIDPDDETPGINKSKSFEALLEENL